MVYEMYCEPSNASDIIDFTNLGFNDLENVKQTCRQYANCKAFYEVSQDGKKKYFGCGNKYVKKKSSNSNLSHILYLKGI